MLWSDGFTDTPCLDPHPSVGYTLGQRTYWTHLPRIFNLHWIRVERNKSPVFTVFIRLITPVLGLWTDGCHPPITYLTGLRVEQETKSAILGVSLHLETQEWGVNDSSQPPLSKSSVAWSSWVSDRTVLWLLTLYTVNCFLMYFAIMNFSLVALFLWKFHGPIWGCVLPKTFCLCFCQFRDITCLRLLFLLFINNLGSPASHSNPKSVLIWGWTHISLPQPDTQERIKYLWMNERLLFAYFYF